MGDRGRGRRGYLILGFLRRGLNGGGRSSTCSASDERTGLLDSARRVFGTVLSRVGFRFVSDASVLAHASRRLAEPLDWVIYLSHEQPERLIVFVHGFRGEPVSTWQRFPDAGRTRNWWRAADLLFVGYDSSRDNISGTAHRLIRELPRFYPRLPSELLEAKGVRIRTPAATPYRELVVVGHSLGAVVVRRALCDSAARLLDARTRDPGATRPLLLDAQVRLFSPASAGFRAAGFLGLLRATALWGALDMYLRRSSAFTDLQPGSPVLRDLQQRTEALAHDDEFQALRASVIWANPDDVVVPVCYVTDRPDDSVDDVSHSSVCKPHARYQQPWNFVESGHLR
jgi:pimeloyl-ACP methyl ester carboxylesterase